MFASVLPLVDEQNQGVRQTLTGKLTEWIGRAKQLKEGLKKQSDPTPTPSGGGDTSVKYLLTQRRKGRR